MINRKFLLIALVFIQVGLSTLLHEIPRKQLAGPPEQFKNHILPTPNQGALIEDSSMHSIWLQETLSSDNHLTLSSSHKIFVDSKEAFSFSVFSPHEDVLHLKLHDPYGIHIPLEPFAFKDVFTIGEKIVPGTSYFFESPEQGIWNLHISVRESSDQHNLLKSSSTPHGSLIIWNKSPIEMNTHLNTYHLKVTDPIGLVTMVTDNSMGSPRIMSDFIIEAQMDVTTPNGTSMDVSMHDDGLHFDGEPQDGIWGGVIPAYSEGIYKAQAVLKGKTHEGVEFLRTTQHLLAVTEKSVVLTGSAHGYIKDDQTMTIQFPVTYSNATKEHLFRAYAEVYGNDGNQVLTPACWISSLVNLQEQNGTHFVELELNLKWLKRAQVETPLILKNVYIQDWENHIPLSVINQIEVKSENVKDLLGRMEEVVEITKEMKQGKRTVAKKVQVENAKLLLTHGYCAGDNPWEKYPEEWQNALYFAHPNANINNQEFAQELYDFVQQNEVSSFGVVAHSQGGLASVTLLNYFQTGMDDAQGERLIQSVGSPYQGTTGAGTAAGIANIFGIGCGTNFDLSLDGAKLWLAGITQETQEQVYFYTGTYDLSSTFGDYCSLLTNTVLEYPNDGTTELVHATLPFGHNMGNTEKQCHTTNMQYPAQYWDHDRNKIMNELAKR